jgi:hypothetical protein
MSGGSPYCSSPEAINKGRDDDLPIPCLGYISPPLSSLAEIQEFVQPSKPIMSTRAAQLGGTASDVAVGKIGVSTSTGFLPIPTLTTRSTATIAWFDDDDVRTTLRRILSQHRCVLPSFRDPVVSDEEAFESLKAGMDNLLPGTKMFLNSGACVNGSISFGYTQRPHSKRTGEFYGLNPPSANLELLARFFERYPAYTDKAFLSVKVICLLFECVYMS